MPLAYEKAAKAEIDRLVKDGVISKIDDPTDWVHPLHVEPKAV